MKKNSKPRIGRQSVLLPLLLGTMAISSTAVRSDEVVIKSDSNHSVSLIQLLASLVSPTPGAPDDGEMNSAPPPPGDGDDLPPQG